MVGIRNTARQDNMIGLCLFLSSMADSKSAYTTTGAGISYRWLVNSNRVSSFDKSYWSLSSTSSWCTCTSWAWTALRDPKKSSQNLHFAFLARWYFFVSLWRKMRCLKSLKYSKTQQSMEPDYHRNANILRRSTVVNRGILNDHCGEQIVFLVGTSNQMIRPKMNSLGHLAISSDIITFDS